VGKKKQVIVSATVSGDGAPAVATPRNLNEAAAVLRHLGKACRAIQTAELRLTERIERAKELAANQAAPHIARRDALFSALYEFAKSHRVELTGNDAVKTVKLLTGSFWWRFSPPAVDIADEKELINQLKCLGLERFIKVTETVKKKELLADQELTAALPGVTVTQQELFSAQPAEVEAELRMPTGKIATVQSAGNDRLQLIASARSNRQGRRKKRANST